MVNIVVVWGERANDELRLSYVAAADVAERSGMVRQSQSNESKADEQIAACEVCLGSVGSVENLVVVQLMLEREHVLLESSS